MSGASALSKLLSLAARQTHGRNRRRRHRGRGRRASGKGTTRGQPGREFSPFLSLGPRAKILDVGAANGATLVAFAKAGFEATGVEPWAPAREVAHELADQSGVQIEIVDGVAESMPVESESVDLVYLYSVLEHVDDPDAVLREAFRVLRPGGGFFFSTSAVLSPFQNEILHFPFFTWYPDRLRRKIMTWARDHRPALVGHTTRPGFFWFRHRQIQRDLHALGFDRVIDRWKLRDGEQEGVRAKVTTACATNRSARFVGDVLTSGMEYLAVKRGPAA